MTQEITENRSPEQLDAIDKVFADIIPIDVMEKIRKYKKVEDAIEALRLSLPDMEPPITSDDYFSAQLRRNRQ